MQSELHLPSLEMFFLIPSGIITSRNLVYLKHFEVRTPLPYRLKKFPSNFRDPKRLGSNPTWRKKLAIDCELLTDCELLLVPKLRRIRHLFCHLSFKTYFPSFGCIWVQEKWLHGLLQHFTLKTTASCTVEYLLHM